MKRQCESEHPSKRTQPKALIDTGSDKYSFVSKKFAEDHALETQETPNPVTVDLAGTGTKRHLTKIAKLELCTSSPITNTVRKISIEALVLDMAKDDLIVGLDHIVELIPLTVEVLLAAKRLKNKTWGIEKNLQHIA